MSEDALNQGIELIRSGNIPMGLKVLAELVKTDPQNDMAWAWLSVCYSEKERKVYCLNRAVTDQSQESDRPGRPFPSW